MVSASCQKPVVGAWPLTMIYLMGPLHQGVPWWGAEQGPGVHQNMLLIRVETMVDVPVINLGTLVTKRIVLIVTMWGHTSVEYAPALLIILVENASVWLTIFPLVLILSQAAWLTGTPVCVVTEGSVGVGCVIAIREKTVEKLCLVVTVSVTTTLVTGTMVSYVLGRIMGSVSVDNVSVRVSGM